MEKVSEETMNMLVTVTVADGAGREWLKLDNLKAELPMETEGMEEHSRHCLGLTMLVLSLVDNMAENCDTVQELRERLGHVLDAACDEYEVQHG